MKISENIIKAKKIIKDIEHLNANPELIDMEIMYDKAIELDTCAQQILITITKKLNL